MALTLVVDRLRPYVPDRGSGRSLVTLIAGTPIRIGNPEGIAFTPTGPPPT